MTNQIFCVGLPNFVVRRLLPHSSIPPCMACLIHLTPPGLVLCPLVLHRKGLHGSSTHLCNRTQTDSCTHWTPFLWHVTQNSRCHHLILLHTQIQPYVIYNLILIKSFAQNHWHNWTNPQFVVHRTRVIWVSRYWGKYDQSSPAWFCGNGNAGWIVVSMSARTKLIKTGSFDSGDHQQHSRYQKNAEKTGL